MGIQQKVANILPQKDNVTLFMKKSSIKIEEVIKEILYGLYHDGVFTKKILIKGGQAIRIKEDIKHRFSVDIDASVNGEIQNPADFFVRFKRSLDNRFKRLELVIIDFKQVKKPKKPHPDAPSFWTGWLIKFKLLEEKNLNLDKDRQSIMALIPDGQASPQIIVELSEYEYCGKFEKMELSLGGAGPKAITYWYSTEMLVVEKIRAICQQHPDYLHRKKPTNRARDFYDIANLIENKIKDKKFKQFITGCAQLVDPIFAAKEVDKKIIKKIFDPTFLAEIEKGWPFVLSTIPAQSGGEFSMYVDILQEFIDLIIREF
ncbi:MAG: nucleotidyl transferase AbiEii/AbiGii toxin family protein [Bacteriovoracales bacterium]|nr:nucleotidyl transferase AbiEii/AbiGii toxin family protein [Bacteriovoracales bacterium]